MKKDERFMAVVLVALVASFLFWVNLTNIGNSAARRAHQHSVRQWGEPITGTITNVDDLVLSGVNGPYHHITGTYPSRLSPKAQPLAFDMLIRDIPAGDHPTVTVWERASTGDVRVANELINSYIVQRNPFSSGGSDRAWGKFGAIVLIGLIWWAVYLIGFKTQQT